MSDTETHDEPTEATDTAPVAEAPVAVAAQAPTEDPAPVEAATDDTARPWHDSDNPLESLWQHFTAEIAALKAKFGA